MNSCFEWFWRLHGTLKIEMILRSTVLCRGKWMSPAAPWELLWKRGSSWTNCLHRKVNWPEKFAQSYHTLGSSDNCTICFQLEMLAAWCFLFAGLCTWRDSAGLPMTHSQKTCRQWWSVVLLIQLARTSAGSLWKLVLSWKSRMLRWIWWPWCKVCTTFLSSTCQVSCKRWSGYFVPAGCSCFVSMMLYQHWCPCWSWPTVCLMQSWVSLTRKKKWNFERSDLFRSGGRFWRPQAWRIQCPDLSDFVVTFCVASCPSTV